MTSRHIRILSSTTNSFQSAFSKTDKLFHDIASLTRSVACTNQEITEGKGNQASNEISLGDENSDGIGDSEFYTLSFSSGLETDIWDPLVGS